MKPPLTSTAATIGTRSSEPTWRRAAPASAGCRSSSSTAASASPAPRIPRPCCRRSSRRWKARDEVERRKAEGTLVRKGALRPMADSRVFRNALPIGSSLLEYRLESVLGAGGFGMTYLGWDAHLEKHVAIKEYLPIELAVRALDGSVVPVTTECEHDYKWGLDRFLLEARTL